MFRTAAIPRSSILKIDPHSRRVLIKKRNVVLRNREFILLSYFLQNVGKVLSRTELIEEVWDRNMLWSTNTVDVHVSTLRRILRRFFHRELIKTVHCVGYIFEI